MAQWRDKSKRDTGPAEPATYSAEKARQGEIILRKPWQRMVFVAGLIIPFVLLFIGWLLWR
jgi:hypothetical protein